MSDSRLTRAGDTGGGTRKTYPPSDHEAITKAARGISDRADTTLSFDAGTRTFTIAPVSGAFDYWIHGRRYVKSAAESIVIADTSGAHWIYYDGATLSEIVDPDHDEMDDLIINQVRVALVYWNATDGADPISADERHGTVMSGASQEWMHDLFGMVWHEGLDISGYALDTDSDAGVSFELTNGMVHDEDVEHDIVDGAPGTQYAQQLSGGNAEVPILYRDDVDGSWTEDPATDLPWKRAGAGRLAYNKDDGDGTWSQVEVTDNRFVIATIVATNDWKEPVKVVQGQAEYTSQLTAIDEANAEQTAWGDMPTPELTPLYRLVMRTKDTFGGTNKCKIVSITDLRQLSAIGGVTIEPHPLAVTAADVLTDNAVLRGNGGGRGIQDSSASIGDDGVIIIPGIGDGGLTNYDLRVGNIIVPSYGMIQMGNSLIGRTSFKAGNIDLDGAILVRNIGGPVTSEIEFIWTESTGDTCRFALPKSAVGNATYNSRSMLLAGPAPADTDFVKVTFWQALGIFHNLLCDTSGFGADLGVQHDLEVEGDIYTDSIKESTPAAGVTVDGRDVGADGTKLDGIEAAADVTDAANVAAAGAAMLPGQAGGQTLKGGTASGEDLNLESTAHATKGKVITKDPHEFQKSAAYDAVINKGSVSGAQTIDWTQGNIQLIAASGALTLSFTPPSGPTMLHLRVTAGAQTVTLPTIRWPGGDAPTFSTSNFDWLHLLYDGTNYDGGFLLDYS